MTMTRCKRQRQRPRMAFASSWAMILFVSSIGRGDLIRSPAARPLHRDPHDTSQRRRRRMQTPSTATATATAPATATSNSFCGPSWDTATCSLDSHCESHSDCDANLGHFCQTNVPDCDVNDLLAEALLGPGSLAGTGDGEDGGTGTGEVVGSESDGGSFLLTASTTDTATTSTMDDPSDHRFCGGDYTSAVAFCSLETHCPNGTDAECPPGSYCYSYLDSCNARDMIRGEGGISVGGNVTEGDVSSDSTWTEEGPSSSSSSSMTVAPISISIESTTVAATATVWENGTAAEEADWPSVNGTDAVQGEEEEEDWSTILDPQTTPGPEGEEEEEDWSALDTSNNVTDNTSSPDSNANNLWCGSSQFDATRNCGVGTPCPAGICPDGLSCYMTACVGGVGGVGGVGTTTTSTVSTSTTAAMWVEGTATATGTEPTTTVGTGTATGTGTITTTTTDMATATTTTDADPAFSIPDDVTSTYYCGVDRDDAMANCHRKCPSGNPGECPSGMTCFGYTGCTAEGGAATADGTETAPTPTYPPFESSLSATTVPTMNRLFPTPTAFPTASASGNATAAPSTTVPDLSFDPNESSQESQETQQNDDDENNYNQNTGIRQNYCAYTYEELETTCVTAPTCNEVDSSCPDAMFCFGDYPCGGDDEDGNEDDEDNNNNNNAMVDPIDETMPSPTAQPTASSPQEEEPPPQPLNLLCFSSMDEEILKATCATAQSCVSGPCPSGMFCYPYNDCEASSDAIENVNVGDEGEETPVDIAETPSEGESLAENNDTGEDEDGDLCPADYVGWYARRECTEYYECNNGPAGPLLVCDMGLKFDILRAQCIDERYVDSECLGPEQNVGSGSNGNNDNNNNDGGTTNQGNDLGLCPDGYVGWYARRDCTEYYECHDGPAGPLRVCDDGTRFDRRSSECIDASMVNTQCIGSGVAQSQPAVCPEGYNGWQTDAACKEYFQCTNGSPGVVRVCMLGFKFDRVRGNCMDELTVNDFCYGPALPAGQDGQPQQPSGDGNGQEIPLSCDEGYTGYIVRPTCQEYYWCQNGVADAVNACGEDLLFDAQLQMCNFADQVVCRPSVTGSGGGSVPTPSPSLRAPSAGITAFPTFAKNPEPSLSKGWSTTASPTKAAENQAEQPPWLAITKSDIGGSGRAGVSFVSVWSLLIVAVPLWLGHGLV